MGEVKRVKDLMIAINDYPHIPQWFTLRQAMAIVREAPIKFEAKFWPRSLLVFDENYRLMGILTLLDIIRGLSPTALKEACLTGMSLEGLFGPNLEEKSQQPVHEVMSPILVTIKSNAPLVQALYLMIQNNVVRLPVLDDDKVIGMIRLSDLFNEVAQMVLGEPILPREV